MTQQYGKGSDYGLHGQTDPVQGPVLPLSSCLILKNSLNFSEPQFVIFFYRIILKNESIIDSEVYHLMCTFQLLVSFATAT